MYYKISRDVIEVEILFLSKYNMRAEDKLLQKSIKILNEFLINENRLKKNGIF